MGKPYAASGDPCCEKVDINVVKRFADVIAENRGREEKGRLVREVGVSNRVDNSHTGWERY